MADAHIAVDDAVVRALIAEQFPHWAGLDICRVAQNGWDNSTFRLGARLKVRLPNAKRYGPAVAKEATWLPRLAPHLPLPIPTPIALGAPGQGYAWPWAVYEWLDGDAVTIVGLNDLPAFAEALAGFLVALWRIDARDGPLAGPHNFYRGGSLWVYDTEARACMTTLGAAIDGAGALAVWEAALASVWRDPPVWVHGDFSVGNLLARDGKLSAVIDFGGLGVGDPACDLVIAWVFLDGPGRAAFRAALPLDAGTWARARGWALWKAMLTLDHAIISPQSALVQDRVGNWTETAAATLIETLIAEHRAL